MNYKDYQRRTNTNKKRKDNKIQQLGAMSSSNEFKQWVQAMSLSNEFKQWVQAMSLSNEFKQWV